MNAYGRYGLISALAAFAAGVFAVDLLTPIGIEVWVFYLPVVLSLALLGGTRVVVGGAGACSAFVLVAILASLPGPNPVWWDQLNRGMGVVAVWLAAAAGVALATRSAQLAAALAELRRVAESYRETAGALQASEDRWRLAMEGGGLGTRDADLGTGREIWSDTQFRILGYEPAAGGAATAGMWADHTHPDDRARVRAATEQARVGHTLYRDEYRVVRPGGGCGWVEVFGRFHYDGAGAAVRYLGVCFDITPRKNLERELLEITARGQQAFGQELHDGVGQDLTGLGLMAQTLAQRLPEGGPDSRLAARLAAELAQAHEKIRDLSRGVIPVEVDGRGLAAALAELAARAADQSGVAVAADCPAGVEVPDHATATHMFRIAQEAVANALRHGRPRHVRVSLAAGPTDLRLRIADDGTGVGPRPRSPNGLGLRIMRYRAGLIGGTLDLGPADPSGTIVTLTLPGGKSRDE
ncbi:MAG TPA: PAS domain-containing protein [Urbifossiella sp.]|jgi:PAS domain S-box-containing protein|nr:PAS domain-containing protein [Urbifossiella sp.]